MTALGLLRGTWAMLRGRLLAVLVLMSLQDAAIFACQRAADFVTNHGELQTLFSFRSSATTALPRQTHIP